MNYIETELFNDDLNIINKNIICLIKTLKTIEEHQGRLDFDTRKIKEYLIKNEKGEENEKE